MHDIKLLEELWIKYRKTKRKPYYIAISFMLIFGGLLYAIKISNRSFSFFKDTHTTTIVKKSTLDKVISHEEKPFLCNKPIYTIQTVESKVKDKPLIPITESIHTPVLPVLKDIPTIEETKSKKRVSHSKKEKKHQNIQHKRKHFNIAKVSNKSAYEEVEKRFHQFHDVDDALFLARVYYSKGKYKKAELWALKTNKLNKTLEESWIIFVKSKIKLGYIDEAKHILLNYIKQSNSQKAKILFYKLTK